MEKKQVKLNNISADFYRCHTLIVGSGAAGLNCAERLFNSGIKDVVIITSDAHGGTSYRSGSDKQTYYKMSNFGDTADSPMDMAQSLFAGGCMHGDMAYIESLYSLPAFYHLVENGVPFPHNKYGAFVGYKTDHDPRQRATSAGPKTSKFMVETSTVKVRERGIPVLDGLTVVKIAVADGRACGLVAVNKSEVGGENLGVTLFQAENIILATGGPGELYAQTVYPAGQVSLHGVALEAGAKAVNLGESQFGLASTKFRWNLSGTYQQVVPAYFSVGPDGVRRNFLAEYFRSLPEMATNIFLKGYQWPFTAGRAADYGSSLVDIAVQMEISAGRRVFMDFMTNPTFGDEVFDIQALAPQARDYLNRSDALQDTPYDRLAHMNPDSIDIYTENGIDLREPLEVAVCFQHNNGGLWIDSVYRTNVGNLYAIGEVAGSHGVARPGGSALNSGQVGGIRVAQYLAGRKNQPAEDRSAALAEAGIAILDDSRRMLGSAESQSALRASLQRRMTDTAGFVRRLESVKHAVYEALDEIGRTPGAKDRSELIGAWETKNLLLTHAAFMKTIHAYLENGGGSRGAYLVDCDEPTAGHEAGTVECAKGGLYRFVKERQEDKKRRIVVSGPALDVSWEDVRPLPEDDSWFETTWSAWREGNILEG